MPSLSEAFLSLDVMNSLKQAWNSTQANNVEYGGWIYYYYKSGSTQPTYAVKTKTDNQNSSILLTLPLDLAWFTNKNYTILADYHCHPGGAQNVAGGRPSDADINNAKFLKYGRIVFTPDTDTNYDIKPLAAPTPAGFPDGAILWYVR